MSPGAKVARGATYIFIQGFTSSFIGVIYIGILAHLLTLTEMGIYTILTFVLTLVQMLGSLALPQAITKYIAQYLAGGEDQEAKSVVTRALQIAALTATSAFLLLFLSADWLSTTVWGTLELAPLLRLLAPAAVLQIFYTISNGFLRGLQRMREMATIALTYAFLQKGLGIGLLLIYPQLNLYAVIYGWLAGLLFSSIASLVLTARFLGIVGKAHPMKRLINFSYPLYISSIFTFTANWVDQLFILPYMGKAYLGMYHIAVRAAVVPSLITTSIVTALFPKLSELYTKGGEESLRNSFRVSTRYTVLAGFPMIVGVAVLAQPILTFFAGLEYAEAGLPLAIICLASLPGALGITIAPSLMTLERTKTSLALNLVGILCKTAVSYITLAYLSLGMIGTSSSRVLAALVGLGLGVYALGRSIKVTFDRESLWKSSLASAIMVISIILSRSLNLERFFPELYLLPLYMLLGAVVYFFSLAALRAIKKEDVELFHDYLPGPLKKVALWLGRLAFVE